MVFLALWEFERRNGRFPGQWNEEDAAQLVEIGTEINEERKKDENVFSVDELDVDLIKQASYVADIDFQPYCAFFGGVVAQEIVKLTGKFTPLNQFLHLDCAEMLPTDNPTDTDPRGDRFLIPFLLLFHGLNVS